MQSYQNLVVLQNLYRYKALGFSYCDDVFVTQENTASFEEATDLVSLHRRIAACHLCDLSKSRTQSMPGIGNQNAKIVFVDYTVSHIEDANNVYMAGRSGEMLRNMIHNVLELSQEKIYYTHLLKCKPLHTRHDFQTEWSVCRNYFFSQIDFIRPRVVVTLGQEVFETLLNKQYDFERMRGHAIDFKNTTLVPIYHPSFVLRNPDLKKIVYNDLKTIKSCL